MDKRASFSTNSYFFACISIRNAGARPAFDIAHPDMDIFINTDKSPALIQDKASGSPLSGFKVKRGAVVVRVIFGGVDVGIDFVSTVEIQLSQAGFCAPGNAVIALHNAAVG